MINPTELKCEYAVNPLGIDAARPRFSWLLESAERAQAQSAYRIIVASSPANLDADTGDKWDSGRVESDRAVNVEYAGAGLASGAETGESVTLNVGSGSYAFELTGRG